MIFPKEIKSLKIVFIFILILILGIGVASYRNLTEVYSVAEWRSNSYNILTFIEDLKAQIVGVEEFQRNYIITGDSNYIQSFNREINNEKVELNNLRILFIDNLMQINRINKLDSLLAIRNQKLLEVIKIRERGNLNQSMKLLRERIEKREIDSIVGTILLIQVEEYNLLQMKDTLLVVNVKNTFYTIIAGTIVSCIIFLVVFYLLDKEIAVRKKVELDIRSAMEFSERLLNSSIDGIIAFDRDCRYTLWNPGMESITGITKENTIGKVAFEILPFLKEIGEDKYYYQTLEGKSVIAKDRWFYIPETVREGYFEAYYSPIIDVNQKVVGGLAIIRNSTQRKFALEALERSKDNLEKRVIERTAALTKLNDDLTNEIIEKKNAEEKIKATLREKMILLREIHHRVKNNLQVISSLLNLQSAYIDDKKSLEIFRESQNRIKSMALIHEKLYQSKDLNKIEFSEYINSLAIDLFSSYNINSNRISLNIDVREISLEIDYAILCGLIINEFISNSLKHAFPGEMKGEIYINLYTEGNKQILIYRDNGIGIPENIDFRRSASLGLQLVNTLTEQLGGEIYLDKEKYTEFKILFTV